MWCRNGSQIVALIRGYIPMYKKYMESASRAWQQAPPACRCIQSGLQHQPLCPERENFVMIWNAVLVAADKCCMSGGTALGAYCLKHVEVGSAGMLLDSHYQDCHSGGWNPYSFFPQASLAGVQVGSICAAFSWDAVLTDVIAPILEAMRDVFQLLTFLRIRTIKWQAAGNPLFQISTK